LVDQAVCQQPSDEETAAGNHKFAVFLRLQLTDGRGDVAGDDTRARPLRIGKASRHHVLGPAVQRDTYRARHHFGYRSPGPSEDLVGLPAEQKRCRATVDLIDMVHFFGTGKRNDPSAADEPAAAVLVISAQPLHHTIYRDVGRRRQPHFFSPLV
jgi:hypothetical protein